MLYMGMLARQIFTSESRLFLPTESVYVRAVREPQTLRCRIAWMVLAVKLASVLACLMALPVAAQTAKTKSAPSLAQVSPITSSPFSVGQRNDEELLILKMTLGKYVLSEAIFGYPKQGSLILPLTDVVNALDFPIEVDAENGRAQGWFIDENRLFSLDLAAAQVIIAGEQRRLDPAFIEQLPDDIYVDVRTLAQWFPVDIEFDLPNLILEIKSREPLPLEARLIRDQRREKVLSQRQSERRNLPEVDVPYQWLSWPMIDTNIDFTLSSGEDNPELQRSYTTLATADVGKLNADIFLSGNDTDNLAVARVQLGRQDPKGHLLGNLNATKFAVGDIFTPQVTHIARTDIGRGVTFSNAPLGRETEFDRITLQGDLQLGWEVELYRNEILLDFRQSQSDGRYLFEDVPLLFGVNVIKLVFYGPQGQRREEIQQLRVGADQIKPGEHSYTFAVNQQDRLLLLGDVDTFDTDGFQGKTRMTAQYKYGVSKNLSLGANLVSVPFEGGHKTYIGTSAVTSLGPIYSRVDLTKDVYGGWAGTVSAQTKLLGATVLAEHTALNDFLSETYNNPSDPLESESRLRVDGVLRTGFLPHIPFAVNINHDVNKSRDRSTSIQNRLSTAIGRASVSNTLNFDFNDPAETDDSRTISGTAQIGGQIGSVRVRGQAGYLVDPDPTINSIALSGDWRLTRDFNARAGITKELTGTQTTTYSTGISTDLTYVAAGIDGQYDDQENYSAKLRLTFSWGKDEADGGLRVASKPSAAQGAIAAHVFRDLDGDGAFTTGVDEPLKGVQFRAGRSRKPQATNEDGRAYITGLEVFEPIIFEVDQGSLEDPFWIAMPGAQQITLRPGAPGEMAFAVVSTGEIDGVIYRQDGAWSEPVSDVRMQLLDEDGEVVKEVRSQYDGFYLMDFIRPGTYSLRIAPEQLARLKLPEVPMRTVTIENDGTILGGEDFVIGGSQGTETAFRVLLAAFENRDAAEAAWSEIKQGLPIMFADIGPEYAPVSSPTGGTTVNLYALPFDTRDEASDACVELRATFGDTWCNPLEIQSK